MGRWLSRDSKASSVRAPEVEVNAGRLRIIADTVAQRFTSFYQRVAELLSVHAGESHMLIDEGAFSQAKRAVLQTEETVTINGKEIHLG